MPKLKLDGIHIFYEEYGEGFPVVLLHPWPTDHAIWMLQIPLLSENYWVITPDARGFGRSERPKKGRYGLRSFSDDLDRILGKLGIEKAFVIGSSLGASIAQRFTIDHGEKVQAAIWVGAPTYPLDELPFVREESDGTRRAATEVYLEALRKGYLNFWNTIWKPTMPYQLNERFVGSPVGSYLVEYFFEERYARLNSDPTGVVNTFEALAREDSMLEDLKKITAIPGALVTADNDDTLPMVEVQHEACPQFEYLVIKNGGHFCFMDNPEVFNKFLVDFLQRHG